MRNRSMKRGVAVTATGLLALVVVGCSSDTATTQTTAGRVPTTSAPTAAPASDGTDDTDGGVNSVPDAFNGEYLGDYTLDDESFGTQVNVTLADGTRSIMTNALPNHETGEFPNQGNPNTISAQDLTWTFPVDATWAGNKEMSLVSGVALNGVKFEPGTAEAVDCDTGEHYRIEALTGTADLGMDFNNAHVQPTGEYHYHGISELLVQAYDLDDDLVLLGFAPDGYLIYYSKSGAYTSGYSLSNEPRTGTGCTSTQPQVFDGDVEGTTPDGAFDTDWVWSVDTGDLDECNGTTIEGQYAYLITDEYPFISRCLNGEFDAQHGGAPSEGGPPPGGAGQGPPPAGQGPPPAGQGPPPTQG